MKRLGSILLIIVFILMARDAEVQAQTQAKSGTESLNLRRNVEYKAGDLKDPFEAPQTEKEARGQAEVTEELSITPLPDLTIQGVVWGSGLPQAIINDQVVKVGDTIEGARIIDINKDGVAVSFGDQQYNLSSPAVVYLEGLKKQGGIDAEE